MNDVVFSAGAWPFYLGALAFGYLLGSVPFGLVVARLIGAGDIRKIGSGNIGATNVLRTGNKPAAAATFLLDAGKGGIAILIARAVWGPVPGEAMAVMAAFGAILGHLFPVWLGFKGGKGVSTFFGTMIALYWPVGLIAGALWIAVALALRISSLSGLVATAATPALMAGFGRDAYAVLALAVAALIWFVHRVNIARLLKGEEPRIGASKA